MAMHRDRTPTDQRNNSIQVQVALDVVKPQVALPALVPNPQQSAISTGFLANIIQVIELLDGFASCEHISDVSPRLAGWFALQIRKSKQKSEQTSSQIYKLHSQKEIGVGNEVFQESHGY